MGILDKRLSQLAASAQPHLEAGEAPEAIVVVEKLPQANWGDALTQLQVDLPASYEGGTTYAVVATRRHLYVLPIQGWAGIAGVTMKLPIESTDVHLEKAFLGFRPDLNLAGTSLTTMAGGKKSAQRLVEFVNERRVGGV